MSAGTVKLPKARVLVVDEEVALRDRCVQVLEREGCDVTACGRGDEALELVRRRAFDVAFVDQYMPRVGGLTLMRAILETNPRASVVVLAASPSVEASIEAIRAGASDFLPKPFSSVQLQMLAGRAAHAVRDERERAAVQPMLRLPATNGETLAILGASPGFRKVLELAARVAATNASVLITGESGCGKELIARFIHEHSPRAGRPFVAINCGAIPETLIESEMFGHRRGAFTGAVRDKPGLFETANGGSLFFDELPEMPATAQSKLLRVIQDGVVRRVGSERTDNVVSIRFIAATNRDPAVAVRQGALREDLFYRLCVVRIAVPPLRERPEDIPLLAEHFLGVAWRRRFDKRRPPWLGADALDALRAHAWRGNVRELHNVIEHAALLGMPGTEIQASDLPLSDATWHLAEACPAPEPVRDDVDGAFHPARERAIAEFESRYVHWLMERTGGNLSKAARIAGVARTTLYLLLQRVGLGRQALPASLRSRTPPPAGIPSITAEGVAAEDLVSA